jgi:hypothetical protein
MSALASGTSNLRGTDRHRAITHTPSPPPPIHAQKRQSRKKVESFMNKEDHELSAMADDEIVGMLCSIYT